MTRDNNHLGKFELTGIPPAPRGTPQIEVTFEIDASGFVRDPSPLPCSLADCLALYSIMKVSAADKGTGKSSSVTIENERGRLSQEEIDRMVADSEKFAEEDELIKKKIEARNGLENFIYSLKSQIGDSEGLGGKLDKADKITLNDEIKKSQDWLEEFGSSASAEDYDEQREALQAIVSPITSKLVRSFLFSAAFRPRTDLPFSARSMLEERVTCPRTTSCRSLELQIVVKESFTFHSRTRLASREAKGERERAWLRAPQSAKRSCEGG